MTEDFQWHVMPDVSELTRRQIPLLSTLFSRDKEIREETKKKYDEIEAEIKAVEDAHWAKCDEFFAAKGWK